MTVEQAEREANAAALACQKGNKTAIHATSSSRLHQTAELNDSDEEREKPVCAVFYNYTSGVESDTYHAADRYVSYRPNQCYGWKQPQDIQNKPPSVNMVIPFQCGMDIYHALQAIASNVGKVSEIYILEMPGQFRSCC